MTTSHCGHHYPFLPNQPQITIRGASINNIENVDCEIPIGRLTCISGVSGSGKSSFVRGVLAPALLRSVGGRCSDFALRKGRWRSLSGTRSISEVVALDQVMPPPNRRSLGRNGHRRVRRHSQGLWDVASRKT